MSLQRLSNTPPWEWPPGTRQVLLSMLVDEDAPDDERLLAAELAADTAVMDDDIVDALLSILDRGDFDDDLRSQAALSLGPILELADIDGFDDGMGASISAGAFRKIQEALRKLHADAAIPKVVRRRALESAVRAPLPWHQDAIRAAYTHRDRDWRLTAVFATRWTDGFDDIILQALDSDDEEIRYEAICAAGNWGIDTAWGSVAPLLSRDHVDKRTLIAAIGTAASLRPDEAVELVADLLEADDAEVVEAAQEVIALGDSDLIFDS